jgi:O-antigen/teichoic acid export membrane protein
MPRAAVYKERAVPMNSETPSIATAEARTERLQFKTMLTSVSIYSAAIMAQRVCSVLLLPLYTRFLTPSDYGTLELLDITSSLLGMFLGANLASSIYYFYFNHPGERERKQLFMTAFGGALLLGALTTVLGLTGSSWLSRLVFQGSQNSLNFQLVFLAMAAMFAQEIGFAWLRAEDRAGLFAVLSVAKLGLQIALNVVFLVIYHLGVPAILLSNLIVCVVSTVVLVYVSRRYICLAFDIGLFVRLFRYSAPIGVVGICMYLVNSGDRYFLQRFASLEQLGYYAVAYKAGMLLSYLQASFSSYWGAQHYKLLREPNAKEIYGRIFTYLMFAMATGVVVISAFAAPGFEVLVAPSFSPGAKLAPWIAGAYLVRAAADYLRTIFYFKARTGLDAIVYSVSAAVCLAGYIVLIPRFGTWGAVLATYAGFGCLAFLGSIVVPRLWSVQLEAGRLGKILVAVTASFGLCVLHPRFSTVVGLGWGMLVSGFYVAAILLLRVLLPHELGVIRKMWGKMRRAIAGVVH